MIDDQKDVKTPIYIISIITTCLKLHIRRQRHAEERKENIFITYSNIVKEKKILTVFHCKSYKQKSKSLYKHTEGPVNQNVRKRSETRYNITKQRRNEPLK